MKKFFICLFALAAVSVVTFLLLRDLVAHGPQISTQRVVPPTAEALKTDCAEIDALAADAFARHPVGSVTVGVVSGDRLIWTKSYGSSDMEKHMPADQDTVYRIGSITKMFTALMLEQLDDVGKVHLSDPVEKYFPEVNTVQDRYSDAPPITFLQLATHTSGLAREPANMATYVQGPVSDWEKTLIAALPHTRYILKPGRRFSYSNIGYAILGAALSRAAGQSYVEYLSEHIFAPLGMTHTALDFTPAMLPHLSKGYEINHGEIDATTPQREQAGRGYKVPNGAIYTTVGDLAHFALFLLGQGPDHVLPVASLERYQMKPAVPLGDFIDSYGIGFQVVRRHGYIAFGHGGDVSGYQASLYLNRPAGVGVIVLANVIGNGSLDPKDLGLSALDLLSE